ncbi:MAG: Eco57I restriction-modification methylase domain-containing protein [Candidatus Avispirillum sp.]
MDNNRLTGSYYTSKIIAQYMADWAIRNPQDIVLEPSFGDGVFLDAAMSRYSFLGNNVPNITGVELQPTVYSRYMDTAPDFFTGICENFLTYQPENDFSAVIGNPPYVSLRNLDDRDKTIAIDCAANNKVKMLTSGSLWMPFIIHSTEMLTIGGRLAFVLPFEFTYVKYAFPLWNYLGENFGSLKIIRIHEDFFPDVDVETIILFADNKGGNTNNVEYLIYDDADTVIKNGTAIHTVINIHDIIRGKKPFVLALLNSDQKKVLEDIRKKKYITPLIDNCKFNIGYVCADKEYFHPSETICKKYKIPETNLIPCISNSKEINGGTGVGVIVNSGQCNSKLYLPKDISVADKKYIKYGVEKGVNLRYKCQQRSPWYSTPCVETPDLILTVFGDTPKLIVNKGKYAVSNSLLAGNIVSKVTSEQLICMWYNSLTLLSIELNIHSLGGGVLVLIPGETDKLEIANIKSSNKLTEVFTKIDECIKSKGVQAAYELGDELVLRDIIGLTENQIQQIKSAVSYLRFWRKPDIRRNKGK